MAEKHQHEGRRPPAAPRHRHPADQVRGPLAGVRRHPGARPAGPSAAVRNHAERPHPHRAPRGDAWLGRGATPHQGGRAARISELWAGTFRCPPPSPPSVPPSGALGPSARVGPARVGSARRPPLSSLLSCRKDLCASTNWPCETLGLSHVAGMCQPHRSCNINEDTGLPLAFTVAHELGHRYPAHPLCHLPTHGHRAARPSGLKIPGKGALAIRCPCMSPRQDRGPGYRGPARGGPCSKWSWEGPDVTAGLRPPLPLALGAGVSDSRFPSALWP